MILTPSIKQCGDFCGRVSSQISDVQHSYLISLFLSWVRTGDEVMFAENGDMFIVDRLKVCSPSFAFEVVAN